MHAEGVKHRAERTAGDDTGTNRRRAQHNLARAVTAQDFVMQRATFAQRNAHEALLRCFRRLADSFWHFSCLAMSEAYATLLVANDHECRKAEPLAALHNLRNAVDVDQLVDQLAAFAAIIAMSTAITITATGPLFSFFARH
jgi:hypothetical protein